jgi:hypothetical protein
MRYASLAALTLAGIVTVPGPRDAAAQELERVETDDSVVTARVSQSIEADSNYLLDDESLGTTIFGDTRFEMRLDQNREGRQFSLGFDSGVRLLSQPEDAPGGSSEVEVASPSTAYLILDQEGPHTAFDADLSARARQVDFDDPLAQFQTDIDGLADTLEPLQEETQEYRYDANVGLQLATSAPSSYELRFIGSSINYSDENQTNLVPRWTAEGRAGWTLRLSPVLSSALDASYYHYEADNTQETEVTIGQLVGGVVYTPSDPLTVTGGIGYAKRERDETQGGERETVESDSGPVVNGTLLYVLPDVTVFGAARWTTAAPDPRLNLNLVGNYALARGSITGRLFNRYTGGDTGEEIQVTGGGIGIERDINTVSRVGLQFDYAHQNNIDEPNEADIDRTDVTATYAYDITELVTAELGYRFRNRIEDPADADSHRVFFNIARNFETGL